VVIAPIKKDVFALDAATGETIWTFETENHVEAVALANDSVYIVSEDGYLYVLA